MQRSQIGNPIEHWTRWGIKLLHHVFLILIDIPSMGVTLEGPERGPHRRIQGAQRAHASPPSSVCLKNREEGKWMEERWKKRRKEEGTTLIFGNHS